MDSRPPGNFIINAGAIVAALMCLPGFFIGVYGLFGILTGEQLVAGFLGAVWSYLAVAGTYELNRRKFGWQRGTRYRDRHLLAGTIAASVGLIVSGAIHETMPGLAILPALSAILQANDGHDKKYLAVIHSLVLATGIGIAVWFYGDGTIGDVLLERIEAMP